MKKNNWRFQEQVSVLFHLCYLPLYLSHSLLSLSLILSFSLSLLSRHPRMLNLHNRDDGYHVLISSPCPFVTFIRVTKKEERRGKKKKRRKKKRTQKVHLDSVRGEKVKQQELHSSFHLFSFVSLLFSSYPSLSLSFSLFFLLVLVHLSILSSLFYRRHL